MQTICVSECVGGLAGRERKGGVGVGVGGAVDRLV